LKRRLSFALLLVACSGVAPDAGTDADLQIEGAQFFRGAMPGDGPGPAVAGIDLQTNDVRPGSRNKPLSGALAREATGAAIALGGDKGYWIVPAGVPDVATPGLPSFSAPLTFSARLSIGAHELVVRAVDAAGRFGPAATRPLTAVASDVADGHLVVSLSWDTEADLDLHVVDPFGVEIYKRNVNSYEPPAPGQPRDPEAWKTGGILDQDSNASCVIDGRRRENVLWKTVAPSGHYVVRVDTFSLCAETAARWRAEALLDGRSLASARGESTETDTRFFHDRGAGVLAFEFDVP
jgi:hypothetical protein